MMRIFMASFPYSGQATPPRFGDFEAQRNWMAITLSVPIRLWYKFDLEYWGLDYPPLTAFHSYVCGLYVRVFVPDAMVSPITSRGIETEALKTAMRTTVLFSDLAIFMPAAYALASALYPSDTRKRLTSFAAMALQPLLVAIDHGHFQYNCVSVGLATAAAAVLVRRRHFGNDVLSAILYVAAIFHKHMALYYAPAFFAIMLGDAVRDANGSAKQSILRVARLGVVVILAAAACLGPFALDVSLLRDVIDRLLPFGRGVYEDYVSNFWCATNPVLRWKTYDATIMSKVCAVATVVACIPAGVLSGCKRGTGSDSRAVVPLTLAGTALSFFLFAFQVHEKGVLYAAMPIAALAPDAPLASIGFGAASVLSCRDLLVRDGVFPPAVLAVVVYACAIMSGCKGVCTRVRRAEAVVISACLAMVGATFTLPLVLGAAPLGPRYPYVYAAIDAALYFTFYACAWLYVLRLLIQ